MSKFHEDLGAFIVDSEKFLVKTLKDVKLSKDAGKGRRSLLQQIQAIREEFVQLDIGPRLGKPELYQKEANRKRRGSEGSDLSRGEDILCSHLIRIKDRAKAVKFSGKTSKKWAVLRDNNMIIYDKQTSKNPNTSFRVQGCTASLIDENKSHLVFQVATSDDQVYYFAALTSDDVVSWIQALTRLKPDNQEDTAISALPAQQECEVQQYFFGMEKQKPKTPTSTPPSIPKPSVPTSTPPSKSKPSNNGSAKSRAPSAADNVYEMDDDNEAKEEKPPKASPSSKPAPERTSDNLYEFTEFTDDIYYEDNDTENPKLYNNPQYASHKETKSSPSLLLRKPPPIPTQEQEEQLYEDFAENDNLKKEDVVSQVSSSSSSTRSQRPPPPQLKLPDTPPAASASLQSVRLTPRAAALPVPIAQSGVYDNAVEDEELYSGIPAEEDLAEEEEEDIYDEAMSPVPVDDELYDDIMTSPLQQHNRDSVLSNFPDGRPNYFNKLYYTKTSYTSQSSHELSISLGDQLYLLDQAAGKAGWFVAKRGTKVGLIPRSHVYPAYQEVPEEISEVTDEIPASPEVTSSIKL